MLTFADLFSGCGGFSVGFSDSNRYRELLAVDNWDAAARTYRENFPETPFLQADLQLPANQRQVCSLLGGRCDVLVGGPPCQGFSTLGKRRLNDRRSSLVDVFVDVALRIRPKVIVMENVRGITSMPHASGRTYAEAVARRLEGGRQKRKYRVWSGIINTQDFGAAQTRRRWLVVAVRADLPVSEAKLGSIVGALEPRPSPWSRTLRDVISDLPRIEAGEGADEIVLKHNSGPAIKIFNHKALAHSARLRERFKHVPPGGGLLDVPKKLLTPHLRKMIRGNYGSGGHIKNIYGRLEWDKPCGTIVAGIDKITCGRFVHPVCDRLLTPRECARIQTFPDAFRFTGGSVAQYYQIGNAVPPAVSKLLASAIFEALRPRARAPLFDTAPRRTLAA
jgi:DNA (cytosine-5)-methyltransferase 1